MRPRSRRIEFKDLEDPVNIGYTMGYTDCRNSTADIGRWTVPLSALLSMIWSSAANDVSKDLKTDLKQLSASSQIQWGKEKQASITRLKQWCRNIVIRYNRVSQPKERPNRRKNSEKYSKVKTGPRTPSCFAPNKDIYERTISKAPVCKNNS